MYGRCGVPQAASHPLQAQSAPRAFLARQLPCQLRNHTVCAVPSAAATGAEAVSAAAADEHARDSQAAPPAWWEDGGRSGQVCLPSPPSSRGVALRRFWPLCHTVAIGGPTTGPGASPLAAFSPFRPRQRVTSMETSRAERLEIDPFCTPAGRHWSLGTVVFQQFISECPAHQHT
jgi:hypothetical protein